MRVGSSVVSTVPAGRSKERVAVCFAPFLFQSLGYAIGCAKPEPNSYAGCAFTFGPRIVTACAEAGTQNANHVVK